MFLPDFMHEVELGSWRTIFIHSLRIVEAHGGPNLIAELDRRCVVISIHLMNGVLTHKHQLRQCSYRQIPSFGRDTVRRFCSNCSELKNMTAREYENLLQVFRHARPSNYFSLNLYHSVRFLSSRGCFQNRIMAVYYAFFSPPHIGMD